tara:strand:- start:61 stop:774 length:714 start_codon:yes stop_codon:yes gene_type:complete
LGSIILAIVIFGIETMAFANCVDPSTCYDPTEFHVPKELTNLEKVLQDEDLKCKKEYGAAACAEQNEMIKNVCLKKNGDSEKKAVENCKIGKKITSYKRMKVPNLTLEKFEKNIYDPKLLAKVLGANVSQQKSKGTYRSTKKISTPIASVNVNNKIKIIKVKDGHFKMISDNYDNAFVYNSTTVRFDPKSKDLKISANTYLKNSAAKKLSYIPFSENIINGEMNKTYKRLANELSKR